MDKKYVVKIDDNFHFGDEDERYAVASFDTLAEAVNKCQEIAKRSLRDLYRDGVTADQLKAQWLGFGEDPFVFGPVKGIPFSAREYITAELCNQIIAECRTKSASQEG